MKKSSGFTLVEMLVAIALLAIIGAALVTFLPTIVTLNRTATVDQGTTVFAKRFFENVRRSWQVSGNFDSGTIIVKNADGTEQTLVLSGTETNVASSTGCTAVAADPDSGVYTPPVRKRVALACQNGTSTFVAEFGRPQ